MIQFITEYMAEFLATSFMLNIIFVLLFYAGTHKYRDMERQQLLHKTLEKEFLEKLDAKNLHIQVLKNKNNISPGKKECMRILASKVPTQAFHKYRVRFDECWEDGYLNGLNEAIKDED